MATGWALLILTVYFALLASPSLWAAREVMAADVELYTYGGLAYQTETVSAWLFDNIARRPDRPDFRLVRVLANAVESTLIGLHNSQDQSPPSATQTEEDADDQRAKKAAEGAHRYVLAADRLLDASRNLPQVIPSPQFTARLEWANAQIRLIESFALTTAGHIEEALLDLQAASRGFRTAGFPNFAASLAIRSAIYGAVQLDDTTTARALVEPLTDDPALLQLQRQRAKPCWPAWITGMVIPRRSVGSMRSAKYQSSVTIDASITKRRSRLTLVCSSSSVVADSVRWTPTSRNFSLRCSKTSKAARSGS